MDIWQLIQQFLSGGGGGYPQPYAPAGGQYGTFTPGGGGAGVGTAGGGAGGDPNWLALIGQLLTAGGGAYYGNQQLQNLSNIYKQQQQDAQIAMNPQMMAARVAAATPQLNSQLAYTVNQAADLGTAGRGMAQAPGAVAAGRAEALAPYAQQNQELGAQLAEFGFPYAFSQQPPNYLSVLQQLQNYGQTSTGLPGTS